MSWQDELRKLDDELAAGRISADDYRSRRDQILSTAVSPGAQQGPTIGESTTMMPPVPGGPQGGGQGDDADKTQIVPGQEVGDSDRTQAVGGWRATPPADPNRTQVVPGVPPQAHSTYPPRPAPPAQPSPPGGFPQPPWQNEEDLAPPWAGQDFPPLAAAGTPDWARQGPEVFDTEKKSSAGKVFGIIAIVVVLVGVAIGAYFMFRPDGTSEAGPTQEPEPPATTSAPPTSEEPQGPIIELPGDPQNYSQIDTFDEAAEADYLTTQEIDLYRRGGAAETAMAVSSEDGVRIIVLVVTVTDETAANQARDGLGQQQLRFTLTARESPQDGVLAAENPAARNGPLLRAHYASGNQVVRVQAQGEDADAEQTNQLFDEVLADQLEHLPANV